MIARALRQAMALLALALLPAIVSGALQLRWNDAEPLAPGEVRAATVREWGSKVQWVDARPRDKFEAGHIEGALLVPLSWLREESKNDTFGKRLEEKLPKKILYIHCRSGGRARTAAGMLRKQGYDARPLKAGFDDLRQAGFSVAK